MGSTTSSSLLWAQIGILWITPGYSQTLKRFPILSLDCPNIYWLTSAVSSSNNGCTRIAKTLWPSRLRKAYIGWLDWYREHSIENQHLPEYLGNYWTLTYDQWQILIDDPAAKSPRSSYGQEGVNGLPGVWRLHMEHLQNRDNILPNVVWAGATSSRGKFDWWWNGVKIGRCVCISRMVTTSVKGWEGVEMAAVPELYRVEGTSSA